jgi:hypothetical protein
VNDEDPWRDFNPWEYVAAVFDAARGEPKFLKLLVERVRAELKPKRGRGHPAQSEQLYTDAWRLAKAKAEARQLHDEWNEGLQGEWERLTLEGAAKVVAFRWVNTGRHRPPLLPYEVRRVGEDELFEQRVSEAHDFAERIVQELRRSSKRSSRKRVRSTK